MTKTILQRVAAGDMAAMQECIDTYGGLVWSLARRLSVVPAEAEDAVQDVFIELWKSAERFDPDVSGETTFIGMIARRRLIDRRRREFTQSKHVKTTGELPEPEAARESSTLELSDEAKKAAAALGELSPDQQRVLTLSIQYGLTHQQIAVQTGLPLGTVKTHARRGLAQIRRSMVEEEGSVDESSARGTP